MSSRNWWVASRRLLHTYRNLPCNPCDTNYVLGGGSNYIIHMKASVIRINETVRTLVTCHSLLVARGADHEGTAATNAITENAGAGVKVEQNTAISKEELRKLSEEIIRLKVLDEADGEDKRKVEDEIRRLSDEVIRLKTQDEMKNKFEEADKIELNKLINDAENRIKTLEDFKVDSKALLQEVTLKVKEKETKVRSIDQKILELEAKYKSMQDFKVKGEIEFKDLKLKVDCKESKLKDLEDFKVKEIARKEAEIESRQKWLENNKIKQAENLSVEENKLKALGDRIADEESRLKKLEEDMMKEAADINELKLKLVEKEGRIKALENFKVKEEARRKAEKETREKTEKERSEEAQKYFVMIGILVTTATSLGLFYIDHMYKKTNLSQNQNQKIL